MGALAAGTIIAGKYRLERAIAQGGMGSVWAAFDTQLEVAVAVKFMAPALAGSPELVGRFEREAKAAAQLRSPHVVQVFEHGVDGGTPFMVMERLEGEDLGARLKRVGRLSLWEAAVILEQVSKALRKAHDAGIVHRDLKPGNIFLARHDEDEIVKVLDFGIAKSAQPAAPGEGTRTGVIMGSPSYMSPEQVRSAKGVDHRSDLWSLGLVMFRMVTGKMAFTGETEADVIIKLCSDPVPVPSRIVPDLPPEVDAFFARALQRDPAERFQSAREMAATFGRIAGRAPSVGDAQAIAVAALLTEAPIESAPTARERAQGPTESDIEKTLPRERPAPVVDGLPATPEKTVPFPAHTPRAAEEVVTPSSAEPEGSTLTDAATTSPLRPVARARLPWVLGAGAVASVIAIVLLAIRGRPGAVDGNNAPVSPTAGETAAATPTVASTPAPSAPESSAIASTTTLPEVRATAVAGVPSNSASIVANAPKVEPLPRSTWKSTAPLAKATATIIAAPVSANPEALPEIPRVLPKK
jgi:eukaryotic-like serine/threonine-protein kinase